jgi:hypothetical protein
MSNSKSFGVSFAAANAAIEAAKSLSVRMVTSVTSGLAGYVLDRGRGNLRG